MNQPIDQAARNSALDIQHSWVVTAPAGSGKTGLLTLRVLKLLAVVQAPEEILAITFTRKAAAEMHERIVGALEEANLLLQGLTDDAASAAIAEIDDPHRQLFLASAHKALKNDADQNWELLSNTHRLKITTIDSFCRELANQLPLLSGAGVSPKICDDPVLLYEQAVMNLIEGYKTGALDGAIGQVLTHLDNDLDRLKGLLVNMLGSREQWLPLLLEVGENKERAFDYLNAHLEDWGSEITSQVLESLLVYQGPLLESAHFAAEQLQATNPAHPAALLLDQFVFPDPSYQTLASFWYPLTKLLLTESGSFRKTVDKRIGFPTSKDKVEKALFKEKKDAFLSVLGELRAIEGLEELLVQLSQFPAAGYTQSQWQTLEALFQLLPVCSAHLKLVFRETSQTDFTEITLSALRALGSENGIPTDLSLLLDYRLNHILIDEFQDTSSIQLNLLKMLTQEWMPGEPRTLFVVGDGMQSCYRFRNANVGIFLNIRDNGLENVPMQAVDLCVNFRSNQAVVNWVNTVFTKAFPKYDDINRGAVTYQNSTPFDLEDNANCHVECHGFGGENSNRAEAQFIAGLIEQQNEYDPEQSVAILVRSRPHLTEIIKALKEKSLPYQAVDIDPLLARSSIQDLLSITRLLLDQSDYLAWLAFLRGPWCGLSLSEMTIVLGDHIYTDASPATHNISSRLANPEILDLLNAESKARIERACALLFSAFKERQRKPLSSLVESLWFSLGGAFCVTGASDLDDARTFVDLLDKYESGGRIRSWREFYSGLQKLYARPAPQDEGRPPIQLMTMHKSKGLEFDTVFVCGLNRQSRADDSPLLFWHERLSANSESQTLLSPLSPKTEAQMDPVYAFLREESKQSGQLEDSRLLYVACTRAKSRLYLTAALNETNTGETKPPANNTMLARIWPAIESEVIVHAGEPPVDTTLIETPSPNFVSYLKPPAFQQLSDLIQLEPEIETAPAFDNASLNVFDETDGDDVSAIIGTCVHRILACMAEEGLHAWSEARIEGARSTWSSMFVNAGVDVSKVSMVLEDVIAGLTAMLNDETAQWILSSRYETHHCEWQLHYGSQPRDAIIDRFFIDNGNAWIIDYKTSTPNPSQNETDFLSDELDQYKAQLDFYLKLVKELTPKELPIKLGLYFPFCGLFVEYVPDKALV